MGSRTVIVIDTHVLIWWLSDPARLSPAARLSLDTATASRPAVLSAISVLEIVTAVRRGRLAFRQPVQHWLHAARGLPELAIEPVSADIAALAGSYGDALHGDPADRLITATAALLGAQLISADEKLRAQTVVPVLW